MQLHVMATSIPLHNTEILQKEFKKIWGEIFNNF